MSDWKNEVVKIEKIVKHQNADNLSIATVFGDYPVVVKNDQYKVGQSVCYIAIDSIVPDTEQFHFLCPIAREQYEEDGVLKERVLGPKYPIGSVPERYRRIRAKRVRGVYSQGLLIDLPVQHRDREGNYFSSCRRAPECAGYVYYDPKGGNLPNGNFYCSESSCSVGQGDLFLEHFLKKTFQPGDSLVEVFELKKWEEPEEENLPGLKKTRTNAEKAPQGWSIPHYDLESVRKFLSCIENEQDVILTEKLHGSNAGFCYDGTRLVVKSRNFYKKRDEDDMWWDVALRYYLETKLAKYPMLVFFGECVGQVKGFRYGSEIKDGNLLTKLYFFDIWDTKAMRFLDYDQFVSICADVGVETTPLIYRGPWLGKEKMYSFGEGVTALGGKHIKEGWVLSLGHERYEPKLDSRLKLKFVSEAYNLNK